MIRYIKIGNFRSIKEPIVLNFEGNRSNRHLDHLLQPGGRNARLSKYHVIFGPNGSGKTVLLEAVSFAMTAATGVIPTLDPDTTPFYFTNGQINFIGEFEIGFYVKDSPIPYTYLFSIDYKTSSAVKEELRIGNRLVYQFSTHPDRSLKFEEGYINKEDRKMVEYWARNYLSIKNNSSTFLNYIIRHLNGVDGQKIKETFAPIAHALIRHYEISEGALFSDFHTLAKDNKRWKLFIELIKSFELGIEDVQFENVDEKRVLAITGVSQELFLKLKKDWLTNLETNKEQYVFRYGSIFVVKRLKSNDLEFKEMRLKYKGIKASKNLYAESRGTIKLFNLLPLLEVEEESFAFVDEIDNSLHALTTKKLITLFQKQFKNKNAQFVFTAHDVGLLDESMFRTDEVFLLEKGSDYTTRLTKLADVPGVRIDRDIGKPYLNNEYGFLPSFVK